MQISDTVLTVLRYPRLTHANLSFLPLTKNWGADTTTMEMERLLLLVSALREENEAAHQLLRRHRLLLSSTKLIMERRIPANKTKVKVRNTCDKAAIIGVVAELTKLERLYSPHKVPTEGDDRVRGSLCNVVDVPTLEQGRECTEGFLRAETDVRGPEEERGRIDGSLRDKADVPGPQEERGRNDGSLRVAEVDVLRLRQEREHTNGSPYPAVDWDNVARLSLTREKGITLSMPATTLLPVHACEPGPLLSTSWDEVELKSRTYNPMGGRYTSPKSMFLKLGRNLHPFGAITGFRTNLGPISFPKGPVKGYILNENHTWVLHATPPGVRRRGARGSRR